MDEKLALIVGIGVFFVILIYFIVQKLSSFTESSAKGRSGKAGGKNHFDNNNRNNKPAPSADGRVNKVMRQK